MKAITVTQARKRLYGLVDEVVESHEPLRIVGKRHSVVLLDADEWEALEETRYLESIPGMRESIVEGMRTPLDQCSEEIEW
jgi:prevent-host-death family protein